MIKSFEKKGNYRLAKFGKDLCWVLCTSIQAYRQIGLGLVQGDGTSTSKVGGFVGKVTSVLGIAQNLPVVGDYCAILLEIGNFYIGEDKKMVVRKIMGMTDELWSEKLVTKAATQTVMFLLQDKRFINKILNPSKGKWYERIG